MGTLKIRVHSVTYVGGTLAYGYGVDEDSGDEVKFAGDRRPMSVLAGAIEESGEDQPADVPEYAVLSRIHKELEP